MRHLAFTVASLTMLVTTSIASAVEATRPFRLDVEGGALVAGSDMDVDVGGLSVSFDPDVGPALSFGAGYALTDHLEVGGAFHAASTDGELFDRNVGYTAVTAGLRYYPLGSAVVVRPWLAAAGGWYRAEADVNSISLFDTSDHERTENGGGLNFAGGLDVPIGRRVSVGGDVRYHQTLGVFDNPGFLTTMLNVAVYFGE